MKKIITVRVIAFFVLLVWMTVIFIMSAQTADKSSQMSGGIVSKLIAAFCSKFDILSVSKQAEITQLVTLFVRKTAHFLEYAILGALAYLVLSTYQDYKYKKITCIAFCVLYATSDEIHQYFVPGRACRLIDICIDTAGSIAMLILISVVFKRKKNNSGDFNAKKETD